MTTDSGRNNIFHKIWHAAVKKRDGGKCQWSGCKKRAKEVHHIIRYSDCPHLRYEVENGISLCRFHHHRVKNNENLYVGMFMTIIQGKKNK